MKRCVCVTKGLFIPVLMEARVLQLSCRSDLAADNTDADGNLGEDSATQSPLDLLAKDDADASLQLVLFLEIDCKFLTMCGRWCSHQGSLHTAAVTCHESLLSR